MLETGALIFAGYAGYYAWPWWYAAIAGFVAGVWNAANRFYNGPWRDRFAANNWVGAKALLFVGLWTGSIAAALSVAIWFVVKWLNG